MRASPITQLAKHAGTAAPRAEVARTKLDRSGRPRGPRFGTLVHALLAEAPLDANPPRLLALSSSFGRLLGATEEEIAAAVEAATAALAHPLLEEARQSGDLRREVSVSSVRDDGSIEEGIIDLAYLTRNGWVVVDFKTDQVVQADGVYAAQLQLYVDAVQRATRMPTRGVLLEV